MLKNIEEKIDDLFSETPADYYHKGYDWNGYEVYELEFDKKSCVGLPLVILVKGEEVRLSTPDESLEYLDYSLNQNAKNKNTSALGSELAEEI